MSIYNAALNANMAMGVYSRECGILGIVRLSD
jgi:hypothetical protein